MWAILTLALLAVYVKMTSNKKLFDEDNYYTHADIDGVTYEIIKWTRCGDTIKVWTSRTEYIETGVNNIKLYRRR